MTSLIEGMGGEASFTAENDVALPSPDPWGRWRRLAARLTAAALHLLILLVFIIGPWLKENPETPPSIPVELVTLPPPQPKAQPRPQPPPLQGEQKQIHRESGGDPDRPQGRQLDDPKAAESPAPNPAQPPPSPAKPAETAAAPPAQAKPLPQTPDATELTPKPQDAQIADTPPPEQPPAQALQPTPSPSSKAARKPPARAKQEDNSRFEGEGGGDRYLNMLRDRVMSFVRFPPGYRGFNGEAVYQLRINRQGQLMWVRVLQSTGVPDLDRVGVNALTRAAPYPPPPPEIPGEEIVLTFDLPVIP